MVTSIEYRGINDIECIKWHKVTPFLGHLIGTLKLCHNKVFSHFRAEISQKVEFPQRPNFNGAN